MARVNSARPPSAMGNHRDAQETNISVVVRVRPRNQKEIRENSPITVTTNGPRGKELHVKSTLGDSTTKTYSFDKAFGPEADQEMIFLDVLAPMLKEVLMGYNCTIFAYGQTGTGKTYTMEGDLNTAKGPQAGMIPRTLYSLFSQLESQDIGEYSVRVSFTELYNEELKDLLSSDEDLRKLRIFDDYQRKGSIVIQNLEETLVKSAADVIAVLQRGSMKRQSAATKMNEVSSRSHSIFCITVHIKETTPEGEELLKVGKLNLVDLAGSENIGRSGALDRRAKEAGMINQSLLTLGRVINALVDRSPHVPYRESKLTRILQDSLVSPAKCNIEETLSTLDYAHRAKNIRNKPEINQKMTKRALLREYEDQISRLKADLEASQTKNGIFLSEESFANLTAESAGKTEEVEKLSKSIKAVEEKYKCLNEQHQQKLDLLSVTEAERESVTAELNLRRQELEDSLIKLKNIQQSLQEQQLLTGAHAETEKRLDKLAAGLVVTLKSSVSDVEGLHKKLERKSALEEENLRVFNGFQRDLLNQISELDGRAADCANTSFAFCDELSHDIEELADNHSRVQCDRKTLVPPGIALTMITHGESIVSDLGSLDSVLSQQVKEVVSMAVDLRAAMSQREQKSLAVNDELFSTHHDLVMQHQAQLKEWNASLKEKIAGVTQVVAKYLTESKMREAAAHKESEARMQHEIAALREQNEQLQAQLNAEREKGETAANELLGDITQLVAKFRTKRDQGLASVGAAAKNLTENQVKEYEQYMSRTAAAAAESEGAHEAFRTTFAGHVEDLNHDVESTKETTDVTLRGVVEQVSIISNSVRTTIASTTAFATDKATAIEVKNNGVLQTAGEIANQRQQKMMMLKEKTVTMHNMTRDGMQQMEEKNKAATKNLQDKCINHRDAGDRSHNDMLTQIRETRGVIACNKLATDSPTGQTPRKKSFRFATTWHVTRKHDDILREYRENGCMVSPTTMARSFEEALAEQEAEEQTEASLMMQTHATPAEPSAQLPGWASPVATSRLPRTKSRHGSRMATESPIPMSGMENVCITRGDLNPPA
ncbi:kinesin motor protein cin8 [Geranomyces variabilis]|nr:kinesin motor protein cin8 [Geranomyces variabilis]